VRNHRTGQAADELVAERLARNGWRIIERNAHTRFGELDLIAVDGEAIVFIEIKAIHQYSKRGPEHPFLAITRGKQQQIRRLATAWLATRRGSLRFKDLRFDVIGITFNPRGLIVDYEHIRAAF
jgi:putative endonuclease